MWWLLCTIPLLIIPIRMIICRNAILKIYFKNWLNWIGIQFFSNIYTLTSNIQSPNSVFFDLVLINRYSNHISSYLVLHRFTQNIPLTYIQPGYSLTYEVNSKVCDLPCEDGTPFTVNKGELILRKRIKGRFGFSLKELRRSNSWPISLDE